MSETTIEAQAPAPPRLVAVGTALPPKAYTQEELLGLFKIEDEKVRRLFLRSHIKSRRLCLPEPTPEGVIPEETPLQLHQKHKNNALKYGAEAIRNALDQVSMTPKDVDYFACVSSTGFLCPSLTAHYIKEMEFRTDVHRIDIVGMGCNGGLNGAQPVVNYCTLNPSRVGLLLCVEICTAAYMVDDTMSTAVTNSLFGDASAAVVFAPAKGSYKVLGPRILGFSSHIVPEALQAMRFDFDGEKLSFMLEKDIPYVLGTHADKPVTALLNRFGLKRRDIKHWIVHSGGKKVIDAIKYALDLTSHDMRHTESVLEELGNISSTSFLFSCDRLLQEQVAQPGDKIVFMTMGPGSTIEASLGEF